MSELVVERAAESFEERSSWFAVVELPVEGATLLKGWCWWYDCRSRTVRCFVVVGLWWRAKRCELDVVDLATWSRPSCIVDLVVVVVVESWMPVGLATLRCWDCIDGLVLVVVAGS